MGALAIVAVAVLLGAMTQTSVGLGLGLVSAPVMTIATPSLMPGALMYDAEVGRFLTGTLRHWSGLHLAWALGSLGAYGGSSLGAHNMGFSKVKKTLKNSLLLKIQ